MEAGSVTTGPGISQDHGQGSPGQVSSDGLQSPTSTAKRQSVTKRAGFAAYHLHGPLYRLYGHAGPVTQVCVRAAVDMVATASSDGTVNIHTIRDPKYVRTLRPVPIAHVDGSNESKSSSAVASSVVELVTSTPRGERVLTFTVWRSRSHKRSSALHCYNTNGRLLAVNSSCGILTDFAVTRDGKYVPFATQGQMLKCVFCSDSALPEIPVPFAIL